MQTIGLDQVYTKVVPLLSQLRYAVARDARSLNYCKIICLGQCVLLLQRIRSVRLVSGPRYSGFLRDLLTNTNLFLCGL